MGERRTRRTEPAPAEHRCGDRESASTASRFVLACRPCDQALHLRCPEMRLGVRYPDIIPHGRGAPKPETSPARPGSPLVTRRPDRLSRPGSFRGTPDGPHPDHLRPAVHQRRQAPGQPGRQPAPGRRLRPLPARRAATRSCCICATDEHGTPAELAAAEDRASRSPTTAPGCMAMQKALVDGFGLSFDHFGRSSSPQNHELTQHFAGRLARRRLHLEERASSRSTRPPTAASCPTATSTGTCPQLRLPTRPRRPVRELHQALDPTDLIDPRSAISGSHRPRGARDQAPLPPPVLLRDELAGVDRRPADATGRSWPPRSPASGSTTRACRTAASPATSTGASRSGRRLTGALARHGGQGLLRLVRRPDRVHRRHRGVGRRARPGRAATGSRWWRDDGRRRRPLHRVHGQGQRPVPHRDVPRHASSGIAASRGSSSTTSRPSTG